MDDNSYSAEERTLLKLLAQTAVTMIAALICGLVGARVAGAAAWPFGPLLRAEGCEQPCWHGIQPGRTTIEEAEEALRSAAPVISDVNRTQLNDFANSRRELCWNIAATPPWRGCVVGLGERASGGPIGRLDLDPPWGSLQLGDALTAFGRPLTATLCLRSTGIGRTYMDAEVHFPGNVMIRAYNIHAPALARFDPAMTVYAIQYFRPAEEPPYRFDAPAWRGFIWAGDQDGC